MILIALVGALVGATVAPAVTLEDARPSEPVPVPAATQPAPAVRALLPARSRYLLGAIRRYRLETWRWQRLMRKRKTPFTNSAARSRDPAYRRWVLRLWKARAARARRRAQNPPRKEAWLCIQRYEGSWRDPGAPYYGGLQMDLGFQRTYGRELLARKGTADNWTPVEQMWVAERAYRSGRGFTPWPNTSVMCAD